MTASLSAEGYEQTREKFRELEARLAAIEQRLDLTPGHLASIRRSYRSMMRQYLEEIRLYEAKHAREERIP